MVHSDPAANFRPRVGRRTVLYSNRDIRPSGQAPNAGQRAPGRAEPARLASRASRALSAGVAGAQRTPASSLQAAAAWGGRASPPTVPMTTPICFAVGRRCERRNGPGAGLGKWNPGNPSGHGRGVSDGCERPSRVRRQRRRYCRSRAERCRGRLRELSGVRYEPDERRAGRPGRVPAPIMAKSSLPNRPEARRATRAIFRPARAPSAPPGRRARKRPPSRSEKRAHGPLRALRRTSGVEPAPATRTVPPPQPESSSGCSRALLGLPERRPRAHAVGGPRSLRNVVVRSGRSRSPGLHDRLGRCRANAAPAAHFGCPSLIESLSLVLSSHLFLFSAVRLRPRRRRPRMTTALVRAPALPRAAPASAW